MVESFSPDFLAFIIAEQHLQNSFINSPEKEPKLVLSVSALSGLMESRITVDVFIEVDGERFVASPGGQSQEFTINEYEEVEFIFPYKGLMRLYARQVTGMLEKLPEPFPEPVYGGLVGKLLHFLDRLAKRFKPERSGSREPEWDGEDRD